MSRGRRRRRVIAPENKSQRADECAHSSRHPSGSKTTPTCNQRVHPCLSSHVHHRTEIRFNLRNSNVKGRTEIFDLPQLQSRCDLRKENRYTAVKLLQRKLLRRVPSYEFLKSFELYETRRKRISKFEFSLVSGKFHKFDLRSDLLGFPSFVF